MDVDIPIQNNLVILVGVNGIGKSTVINIFYYLASRQWQRLSEFESETASIEINDHVFSVNKTGLTRSADIPTIFRHLPPRYVSSMRRLLDAGELGQFIQSDDVRLTEARRLSEILNMPPSSIRELHTILRSVDFPVESLQSSALQTLSRELAAEIGSQILYLPTYRRIEKDLRFIFPELDEDVSRYQRRVGAISRRSDHYVELVSFGMEDVDRSIRETLEQLKEEARTALNGLAGSYLRDVIRGTADTYDRGSFRDIDEETISDTLDRVEERTLPESDKVMLRGFVQQLRHRGAGRLRVRDKYLAHFFSRLMNLTRELRERERPIRAFASICKNYLEGKRIDYDEKNYRIDVLMEGGKTIELTDLSSGEKQIVSLFSHIYLRRKCAFWSLLTNRSYRFPCRGRKDAA